MGISEQEAKELAEKYLSVELHHIVLRQNIKVTKSGDKWNIEAITTPVTIGDRKERIKFTIEEYGRVGAVGTSTV